MGARLLRSSLVQPLKSAALINQRLDAVSEIVSTPSLFSGLSSTLESFPDLEQVTSYLLVKSSAELAFSTIGPINPKTITLLLHLKSAIEKVSDLVELLQEHAEGNLLRSLTRQMQEPAATTTGQDDQSLETDASPVPSSMGRAQSIGDPNSLARSLDSDIVQDASTALETIRSAIDTKIGADAHAAKGAEALRAHQVTTSPISFPIYSDAC